MLLYYKLNYNIKKIALANLEIYEGPVPKDVKKIGYIKALTSEGKVVNCKDPILVTSGNTYMSKGKWVRLSQLLDGICDIMPIYPDMPEPSDASFYGYIKESKARYTRDGPFHHNMMQEIRESCPALGKYLLTLKPEELKSF